MSKSTSAPTAFVSYAHEDATPVFEIVEQLEAQGVSVFYDERIPAGSDWSDSLASAIQRTSHFLFFVSPRTIASENCRRELNFAQEENKSIITVHIEPTRLSPGLRLRLNDRQAILGYLRTQESLCEAILCAVMEKTRPVDVVPAMPNSVAVLPFANLSPDQDDAYFAAGIYEEVMSELARFDLINLISPTTMLQYVDSNIPPHELARTLRAETIIEGSVCYADNRVRVELQSLGVSAEHGIWSEAFERDRSDIAGIQSEIAQHIATQMRAQNSGPADRSTSPGRSSDAYVLYLQSGALIPQDYRQAHELLDEALSIDPEFYEAHARKAGLYTVSLLNNTQRHGINRDSLKRNLIRHAERAAELRPDSRLIEHYQALIYLYQWRWRAALREIRRGRPAGRLSQRQIQLEAVLHGLLRDHATSLRMCREALELDPANAEAHQLLSFCYETAGQIDNAATSIRDAIKLRPTYSNYYRHLVRREIALGHHTEAAKVLQLTERLGAAIDEPAFDADLCYFYGRLGEGNAAEAAFSRLAQHTERIGEGNWALAYLGLLDREKALQHIAAAVAKVETWQEDDGFWSLNIVRTNCANDPILNEPEFVELRKRLTPND